MGEGDENPREGADGRSTRGIIQCTQLCYDKSDACADNMILGILRQNDV